VNRCLELKFQAKKDIIPLMEQFGIGFKKIAKYGIILENYRLLEYLASQGFPLKTVSSYHLDYDWFLYTKTGLLNKTKIAVAVSQGAPMAVDLAERYISSGVKHIVRIGTTGSLVDKLNLGEVVVPYASIRDEGTSKFYIHKNAPAITDIEFSQRISGQIRKKGITVHQGISWSTDGRWKENDQMVKDYTSSGAIAGDMESSALFAIGLEKKVSVVSASILSDDIHEKGEGPKGLSDKDIWFNVVLPTFKLTFEAVTEVFNELDNEKTK